MFLFSLSNQDILRLVKRFAYMSFKKINKVIVNKRTLTATAVTTEINQKVVGEVEEEKQSLTHMPTN